MEGARKEKEFRGGYGGEVLTANCKRKPPQRAFALRARSHKQSQKSEGPKLLGL